MIKAKIENIDLNTGFGTCQLEASSQKLSFNVLKLQDGDSTSLYRLAIGQEIYFSPEALDSESGKVDAPYYLVDFGHKFDLVKNIYKNQDRTPLIGDLVKTENGITRIAKVYDDMVQLGPAKPHMYLVDGIASYSGGLDYPIPIADLSDLGTLEKASFWTFKDGARASNGVDFEMNVKVWSLKTSSEIY